MSAAPLRTLLVLLCCLWAAAAVPRAVAQEAPQPRIVGISVAGCVALGSRIVVRGSGFGRAGGRALVLRDPNASVALPVAGWTDRSITATVPRSRQLTPGGWYELGIQETRSGNWISARGRPLQICDDSAAGLDADAGSRATVQPASPPRPRPPEAPRRPLQPEPQKPGTTGAAPSPLPPASAGDDSAQETDEVLAVAASLAEATALAQQVGALGYAVRSLQDLSSLGFAVLRLGLPSGLDVPAALAALRQAFPATLFDANTLYQPDAGASDAGAPDAGALATAEPRHYAKALIGWPATGAGCRASAQIGLIDTRVDLDHEALRGRQVTQESFIAAGVPPAPPDHGTAVAALLVGATETSAAGLLPAARLHAAAIFSVKEDDRVVGTTEAIARAVDWLGRQGVRVVNLSLSGPGNQVMRLTVERASQGGMLLIAAAGNQGPNAAPVFPAGYATVMAVTAVDAALQPYQAANRGDYIDLAAPGVDVWSAQGGKGGRYNSGTSFATPFAAAAAALILASHPDAAPAAVRQSLQQGARDLGNPGHDPIFGWGLLQTPAGC